MMALLVFTVMILSVILRVMSFPVLIVITLIVSTVKKIFESSLTRRQAAAQWRAARQEAEVGLHAAQWGAMQGSGAPCNIYTYK